MNNSQASTSKKQPHGWLVIDKILGMTSRQVVSKVTRLIGAKALGVKVGHAGTLDPEATGILPIAIGEATKTIQFATDSYKIYEFTIHFGESRTTEDREGDVIDTNDKRPNKDAILNCLPEFIGEIEQVPPIYSAVHVDGKRAYALARKGKDVTLSPRIIHIKALSLTSMKSEDSASFRVECGKGTYIRSIARDICQKLGVLGYVSHLRRISVGNFSEKDAISLDKLEELMHNASFFNVLRTVESVLDDIPVLHLNTESAQRLRHGQSLDLAQNAISHKDTDRVCIMLNNTLVAIGCIEHQLLKPIRVFNHN